MMSAPLEQVLEEHHRSSCSRALTCCRRVREEAREVLQSACLKILQGRARLNGAVLTRAWIFGVTRMTARELRRRSLRRMLDRLSLKQRGVLHLVFYQDMTIEEASEAMGISIVTARAHYERGKARLRGLLEKETPR